MVIDIRKDVPEFEMYVARRVSEHVAASKKQKKPKPEARIDFGFEFGQANWVALVFDTRKDAEPDGEWSRGINKILLKRPKWPIWHKLPDDANVEFTDLKGKKVNVMKNPDEMICKIIGDALKHVLITVRDKGVFKPLLKTEKCELGVENLEGYYGWPAYEKRGRENLA